MVLSTPNQPPTGTNALRRGAAALRAAGIEDATLEAELLLRHILGLDKTAFYLRMPELISTEQQRDFLRLLGERAAHKPSAYLTGHREFYGLDFHVQPGVLIPRPETELVVEKAIALARERIRRGEHVRLLDAGTGSGAIAIAIAKQLPAVEVLGTDISPDALVIAAYNAKRLRVAGRVRFMPGNLLDAAMGPVDLITANLPYIPTAVWRTLAPEVRDFEPRLALDGGEDGLDQIRRLIQQLPARLCPGGAAILEIGFDQGAAVHALAGDIAGARCTVHRDLAGKDRVAIIEL